jgi:two-component system chemotaxis sensor kinase CheA
MTDDDEILQDFLVEAGEILEQLSEQLVDLERAPDDADLLNAIFRGFHTVKGGAGFLQLDPMVDLCHVAENVFDILRKGETHLNADIMDTVLRALDSVNVMFNEVRSGSELTPAEQDLLDTLQKIADGESITAVTEAAPVAVEAPAEVEASVESEPVAEAPEEPAEEITAPETTAAGDGDLITDDEFEDLLDALQAEKASGGSTEAAASEAETPAADSDGGDDLFDIHVAPAAAESDEITEEEFEALLNELQAKGKAEPKAAAPETSEPPAPEPTAEIKAEAEVTEAEPAPAASSNTAAASKTDVPETPKAPVAAAKKSEETPVAVAEAAPKKPAAAPKAPPKQAVVGEATVRVDTRRLDDIMNMVGELVLVRNRLVRLGTSSQDEEWSKAVSNLDVVTADLQTSVMKTRMQPIKKVFGRFPRVVRDLARSLEKEISLELMGEETDLDKNLVEALADPLVHLVRNSVDHGIELPDDREKAGKPRGGTIILSAEQEGDHILLTIDDDGRGMDPEALKQIAINKGVIDADTADRLSDSEAFGLIFAPGFSTKEVISDVSGRGVGMDVVKTKITQLNGTVDIQSELGKGTRIAIKVPLTLAIMPTLMVMLADQTFALPLVSVNEIFHLNLKETNVVDGQEVITVRDTAIPLYYLSRWLVPANESVCDDERHVVIVSVGNQRVGFVVDQLIGQEEVVIKPLGKMLQGTDGMAGATITGDGTIALILDVPGMLKRYG